LEKSELTRESGEKQNVCMDITEIKAMHENMEIRAI